MKDAYQRLLDGEQLDQQELEHFESMAAKSPELTQQIQTWRERQATTLSTVPESSQLITRTGSELMPEGSSAALNTQLEPDSSNVYVLKINPPRSGNIVGGVRAEAGNLPENVMTIEGTGVSRLSKALDRSKSNDHVKHLSEVYREVMSQGVEQDEPFAVVYEKITTHDGQLFDGTVVQYRSANSDHNCLLAVFWPRTNANHAKVEMVKSAIELMKSNPDDMLTYLSQQLSIATQTDITNISPHKKDTLPDEMAVFSVVGGQWESPDSMVVNKL